MSSPLKSAAVLLGLSIFPCQPARAGRSTLENGYLHVPRSGTMSPTNDLCSELEAARLPLVLATTGLSGGDETRDFYLEADQAYHWNRNAETYFLIGQGLADSMELLICQ